MWAAAALTAAPAAAQPAPPQGVELRSEWEIAHPACNIHRDGGASVPMPGTTNQSLWLFGDASIAGGTGCNYKSFGTHGAVSINTPGQAPTVSEIPTPGMHGVAGPAIGSLPNGTRGIARFLPNPTGLKEKDGVTDCTTANGSYQASWYGGATKGPNQAMTLYDDGTPVNVANASNLVFISYEEVCVDTENGAIKDMLGERTSFVVWNPAINSFIAHWTLWDGLTDANTSSVLVDANPATTAVDAAPLGGSLYFITNAGLVSFGADCLQQNAQNQCQSGRAFMVGVATANVHQASGYKYFTGTGSGWTYDRAQATPLHALSTNGKGPLAVAVGDFANVGKGMLMYDKNALDASYQLWQYNGSTWNLKKEGVLPGADCNAGFGCYVESPHPELSTSTDLIYSVYDPVSAEVEITSIGTFS
jgi:hypothetical protein